MRLSSLVSATTLWSITRVSCTVHVAVDRGCLADIWLDSIIEGRNRRDLEWQPHLNNTSMGRIPQSGVNSQVKPEFDETEFYGNQSTLHGSGLLGRHMAGFHN
jgi:hypothetical protein